MHHLWMGQTNAIKSRQNICRMCQNGMGKVPGRELSLNGHSFPCPQLGPALQNFPSAQIGCAVPRSTEMGSSWARPPSADGPTIASQLCVNSHLMTSTMAPRGAARPFHSFIVLTLHLLAWMASANMAKMVGMGTSGG